MTWAQVSSVEPESINQVWLLTWNVQHAAASRTHQQAVWLATADPHEVLVLTEVAAGESGELLARLRREFGYTIALPDAGEDKYRCCWPAAPGNSTS